ncbi:phosphopantetheine-binding protein [Luteimonas lutimaris]|uniref:Carrier domain-containing protein n=1 Tax=Luteimonas lutimaris TaxID=698645 RepID=A0ABP7MHD0_9GAMM
MDAVREQRMQAQLQAIQARLDAHPGVVASVAAIRGERLVAYVEPVAGASPTPDDLRAHAAAGLPAYMVPRDFVLLAALPRAADGSVDRAALPDPAAAAAPARDAATGGTDDRVAYLAGLWSQLLGREAGPDDNFFDLGGHSMLAVQMANRVKTDTGVRIQLMTLASQTLAQIAAELPATAAKPKAPGLGARLAGNLRGMLRGAGAGMAGHS